MRKFYPLLLLPILLLGIVACNRLTPEEAKDVVMRTERDRLPLIVQRMSNIENITIDSMRIVVDKEPMTGYLYTTWLVKSSLLNILHLSFDTNLDLKPIIVEVTGIRRSKEHKGMLEWDTHWEEAHNDVFRD